MTATNNPPPTAPPARSTRVILAWVIGLLVVAVVGSMIVRQLRPPPPPAPESAAAPDPSVVVGRWVRPDGGYILELKDPRPGHELTAVYFNPQPVNVGRAEWKQQDGQLEIFVELRAPNYPGSTYSLAYDPATDRLAGIYYQAALQQQFDVAFERVP